MGEIVNLRRARKQKARAQKDEAAAQNRLVFGRSRADRDLGEARAALDERKLDGHRIGMDAGGQGEPGSRDQ